MKREIKFRAWVKPQYDREEKMVYFDNMHINGEYNLLSFECDLDKYEITYGSMQVKEKDLFVMQYTGLKDKHGKEIYEGDIYKWGNTPPEYKEIPRYPDRLFHLIGERVWVPEDIEIVGNIYSNPELLTL